MLRVYLTNLGKYNEGELVGEWLELPTEKEEIKAAMKRIKVEDGTMYEEYFITDFESEIGLEVEEYTNIYELNEQLKELEELESNEKVIKAIIEVEGSDLAEVKRILESQDYYFYEGLTIEEYEEQMVEECYDLDFSKLGNLQYYITIDYAQMARDDFDAHEVEDGVIVIND